MLLVCECLSALDNRVSCDDIADVRQESFVLAVEFRISPCKLSVSLFNCVVDSDIQCIAPALTNPFKWIPNRKMHPIICSILRAIA